MMNREPVTDRIVAADLCTGCGACAAVLPERVTMTSCDDGFLRPTTRGGLSRRDCQTVLSLCPGHAQSGRSTGAYDHPLWGSYQSVAQGWAVDSQVRHEAASGGALSATLIWLLETGRIDGVLHVAADAHNPTGNCNTLSRNKAEVLAGSASRYAPSAPLTGVPALLDAPGRYAFVGKPCDVVAMRRWVRMDERVSKSFPVMLSFFCAGVPSELGAKEIVETLGVRASEVREFRYRGRGWPGNAEVLTRAGERHSMSYQDSWGKTLSHHVQPRCRICADGTGLEADITFGDAWQTDAQGYPLFADQLGRSLILARNEWGQDMLRQAEQDLYIETAPARIEALEAMQPGQSRRRRELLGRLAGRVLSGMPIPRYRGLGVWACARLTSPARTVRAALGMARRCIMRRRSQSLVNQVRVKM